MIPFSTAIKTARERLDYTQDEVSEILINKYGIKSDRSIMSKWEQGQVKKFEFQKIKALCEIYGLPINNVTVDTNGVLVIDKESAELTQNEKWMLEKFRLIDEYSKEALEAVLNAAYKRVTQPKADKTYVLPYYDFPACAGTGNYLDEVYPSYVEIKDIVPAGTSYILPISGDSMEPTYHDGDHLYVQAVNRMLDVGEIGIFVLDGNTYIKQVGNNCLISHNDNYEPIYLRDYDEYRCLGRVLGVCKSAI